MASKLNDDKLGEVFKEILRNEGVKSFTVSAYSNEGLFNEICNILKNLKYLGDQSLLKIVGQI